MTVYSCAPTWDALLTCIYTVLSEKKGHRNVRIVYEPIGQYSMFDEYIHVESENTKAEHMTDTVCRRVSPHFLEELAYVSMAYEEDTPDVIYHVLLLGFAYGPNALEMVRFRDVMRFCEIRKRVGWETCHFREFARFHEVDHLFYVAHIEPKSRILPVLAGDFTDRMPSEYWILVDDTHREAVIHPKDEPFFFRQLSEEETARLLQTEQENDEYTEMWKAFFRTIAIEQRKNERCQTNHFPKWTRKHAVEFF